MRDVTRRICRILNMLISQLLMFSNTNAIFSLVNQNHQPQARSLPEQVPAQDSPYILAPDNLKLWVAQKNRNRTNRTASPAKEMEMDWSCAAHATSSTTTSCPQVDPWWPQEERQTERNMEENSGDRDEGEQLDMGWPATTSTRQKPMAYFGRGLMCFETRRGLSKLVMCWITTTPLWISPKGLHLIKTWFTV